jgi:hypothetical protein
MTDCSSDETYLNAKRLKIIVLDNIVNLKYETIILLSIKFSLLL